MRLEILIDDLYNQQDPNKRRYIPDKLAKLGDWRSTIHLGKILVDQKESSLLRNECAESLGKQGDPEAIGFLQRVLMDPNSELRRTAIWSLGQIGDPKTMKLIYNLRTDPNRDVKRWVAKSLGRVHSSKVCELLIELYEHYQGEEEIIIADNIRAMRAHVFHTNCEERKAFGSISQLILQKSESKLECKAASLLLLDCVSLGYQIPGSILKNLLLKFNGKSQILPQIIEISGFHDKIPPISIESLDISFVNALMHNNNKKKLLELYSHSSRYSPILIGQLIKNLANFCVKLTLDTRNFEMIDLNLVLAIVEYKVICEHDRELLDSTIERGKGLSSLILLYSYFPDITIQKIRRFAISGTKTQREAVIKCINSMQITTENKDQIVALLTEMESKEKIWHIRRDIRFVVSLLTKD